MSNEGIQIHQVQLQYQLEEDRLLFSLNTLDKKQFRMFLTRRFLKLLWPILTDFLASDTNMPVPDEQTKKAVLAFQQDAALQEVNFKDKFATEDLTYPWTQTPILVTDVVLKTDEKNNTQNLGFYSKKGLGMEFGRSHKVLHYLYKAVQEILPKSEWDLNLEFASLMQTADQKKDKLN